MFHLAIFQNEAVSFIVDVPSLEPEMVGTLKVEGTAFFIYFQKKRQTFVIKKVI